MPRKRPPPPTPEQIRRDTGRLYAAKGAAMRDLKAIQSMTSRAARPKGRQKRAAKLVSGIHMGSSK